MLSVLGHGLSRAYTPSMRHLTRGRRLPTGRMSNETWCGQVSLVECVACLDALSAAGERAVRRKAQLARNAER